MKRIFLLSVLSAFGFLSCSTLEEDCLCTAEFRFYLVTVVDTLGVPVDSLNITVKDKDGGALDVQQETNIFSAGKYTVLNDSFTKMFCDCGTPQNIYFSATDGIQTAEGQYLFNTDECKCHINKVSGPDTLVLR